MADGVAGRGGTYRLGSLTATAPAVTLLFLNLMDGLFTLIYLQLGLAQEANPVMRAAYEFSPMGFMAAKLAVVNAGTFVLCLYQQARVAQVALKASVALYAVIVTWHLAFLANLITS